MSWAELSGEPKMRIAALLDGGDTKAARLTCRGWVDMPPAAVKVVLGTYRSAYDWNQGAQQQMEAELSSADRLLLETQQLMRSALNELDCTSFRSGGLRSSREWILKSPPDEAVHGLRAAR